MKVNETKCKHFYLNEGLPQGSAISPLLFLIFINYISTNLAPDTLVSLFADDTAIEIHELENSNMQENTERMQKEVDQIQEWANEWKMKINEGKTKALIISTKPADLDLDSIPKLKLNGEDIKPVKSYKFLGVKADQNLKFSEHVNDTIKACTKRVNILKCLSGRKWGQSLETQRKIYMTFIRTKLEYGSSSWWDWVGPTNQMKLERVQNAACRTMAGLTKGCPVDFLNLEAGVEPLHVRMRKNNEILVDKYRRLPEDDDRRILLTKAAPVRLKTRHGWRNNTKVSVDNADFNTQIRILKPWTTFENIKIDKVPL